MIKLEEKIKSRIVNVKKEQENFKQRNNHVSISKYIMNEHAKTIEKIGGMERFKLKKTLNSK